MRIAFCLGVHQPPLSIHGKFKIQCFGGRTLFFPDFLRAQNMVRVIEGKIIWKWSEGKQKLLRVSGSFELSRVRVSEGKITVNVWRKSRGNRFWFELARVRVIESQLYRGCAFSTTVMENRPIVYDKIAEDVATFKAKLRTFLLRKYFR